LEQEIERFIDHYNKRYHEALGNVTPSDGYYGKLRENITRREQLKQKTLNAQIRYNISQSTAQIVS
jgi:putative transposase